MSLNLKLMASGESGVSGLIAPRVVEARTNGELGHVTTLFHNMEEMLVPLMENRIRKLKNATKVLVQVSTNTIFDISKMISIKLVLT